MNLPVKGFLVLLFQLSFCSIFSQELEKDWRYMPNGDLIHSNGYVDQPYLLVDNDGAWICVYTTSNQHEGAKGQHIAVRRSRDQGKSWSEAIRIEEPGTESASWGVPYLTSFGRIYVFFDYNGDKIHHLGSRQNIREDMLGWYCFRYSDDQGKTWSDRYRIPMRKTAIDYMNQWKGKVQIFWGIDKPKRKDNGLLFAFTKIGEYMLEYSEGWLYHCNNIEIEKDPTKLNWQLLPEGENGIRSPDWGDIQEEQNTVHMDSGTIACLYRTTQGHPLIAYSHDQGHSWTAPEPPLDYNGRPLKNPRANPKIWKCSNGRYLLWYHHNGTRSFYNRNPAWIAGGVEQNGKIIWTQPELLLYHDKSNRGPSYPDLIELEGKYWMTETQKTEARIHEIPTSFLELLWSQFNVSASVTEGLVLDLSANLLEETDSVLISNSRVGGEAAGFTFSVRLKSNLDMARGNIIVDTRDATGKGFWLEAAGSYTVKFSMSDGINTSSWQADPGILQIRSRQEQEISVSIDYRSRIIQFIIDGVVGDGKSLPFGWGRIDPKLEPIKTKWLHLNKHRKTITGLKYYNRPLLNTEIIGAYRFWKKEKGLGE